MTEQKLRDLLRDRVADVASPDLSVHAWRAGERLRRRRRLGSAAVSAAAVLAVVGGVALLADHDSTRSDPGPSTSSPTTTRDEPDAMAGPVPVWWSPDPAQEDDLPQLDTVLPEFLDLAEGAPSVETNPISHATSAFAVFDGSRLDRVMLTGPDGYRTLDVSQLEKVPSPNGYRVDPVSDTMLSPGGTALLFPQDGHWLEIFDVRSGTWASVDVDGVSSGAVGARWLDEDRILLPGEPDGAGGTVVDRTGVVEGGQPGVISKPFLLAQATLHGPARPDPSGRRTAQAFSFGAHVPVRDPGADLGDPETVVISDDEGMWILAVTTPANSSRFKNCCPVVGWTDDQTVVYESRGAEPKLIGWRVGTDHFELISRIVGLGDNEGYVASFALLYEG